ncbi:hypothetical protein DAH66_02525 [Sphingomonas koreensis]|jgi:hypothetical protein|uniref:Uncharacterized protein n=1 Tax=Sphingomonas koreensis TaxID=93064 RepID=A0A430G7V0_9SPHN|nr:hypothetical protein [Sphingomonas koreensis]PKP92680.1 MAG: hypothetical protein CVT77_07880 [Alphaproteobacteria bacterium HGW-Alphaproteobacteria-16]RSY89549.1 hypothetical protein DAH66_02525 [Sphingomonas koreensis]
MSTPISDSSDDGAPSARVLLERYCYGHTPDVEAILRFAHDHRLTEDNLVFLLVAILKVNEGIVGNLLTAITSADHVIDNAKHAGQALRTLSQTEIAQIEAAGIRAAGHLNVAADRLMRTAAEAEQLGERMLAASGDLIAARGAFEHATELIHGRRALDSMIETIRRQAQADLRGYHSEIIEGLQSDIRRELRGIHAYGLIGLGGWLVSALVWLWA